VDVVKADVAFVADDFCDGMGQFGDGDVRACADVDALVGICFKQQEGAGIGEVVGVEELAQGRACAPEFDVGQGGMFGVMQFSDEGRDDVACEEIVVVAGAVEVGGHDGQESRAVLLIEELTEFQAGDFGDGVGFVGGFQGACQQVGFENGLGAVFGVDAA